YDQSRIRHAISTILAGILSPDAATRRVRAIRQDRNAASAYVDRRNDDPPRRCRLNAMRHIRHAQPSFAVHRSANRSQAWGQALLRNEHADVAQTNRV